MVHKWNIKQSSSSFNRMVKTKRRTGDSKRKTYGAALQRARRREHVKLKQKSMQEHYPTASAAPARHRTSSAALSSIPGHSRVTLPVIPVIGVRSPHPAPSPVRRDAFVHGDIWWGAFLAHQYPEKIMTDLCGWRGDRPLHFQLISEE